MTVIRVDSMVQRAGGMAALAVTVTFATLAVAATPADAVVAANGHYAGRGQQDLGVSFDVNGGMVQNGFFEGPMGSCGVADDIAGSDTPNPNGKFHVFYNGGTYTETLNGRFVSPTEVHGKFIYTTTTSCPGTYERKYTALRFTSKSPGGGSSKVRDGHYAGAGKDVAVWFDIEAGELQNTTYIHARQGGCTIGFGSFDMDSPNSQGRFVVHASDSNNTLALGGRFFSPTALTGKLSWTTTLACPPGTVKLPYGGKHFKIPG